MFTVCPKCTLTLVVTTVDLRAGQGYVRCGRCANVFNALIALREGEPGGSASDSASRRLQETTPPATVNPAVGAGIADFEPEPELEPEPEPEAQSEPDPQPEPEPIFEAEPQPDFETEAANDIETEVSAEEPSLEFDAASTDVSEIFVSLTEAEQTGSGSYEAVVLSAESAEAPIEEEAVTAAEDDASHADTIARADWSLLDEEPVADVESVIEESPLASSESDEDSSSAEAPQPDPPWVEEMFAEAEAEAERVRTAERAALAPALRTPLQGDDAQAPDAEPDATEATEAPADPELEPLLKPTAKPRPGWQLTTGVAALGLLLLAQMVHFNRQQLVLNQTFGPAISRVYGWFGLPPTPHWDLSAYSVKQLGAEAEGGEGTQLLVRLSLQNESSRVQPLPLLRLTLQDRYGNAVATRDLEPRDYLPPRAANQRLLEPDQRIDAELHVIDPGRAAIGFEIDACLRGDGGNIGCANDARRSAG